jgi:hypothetical protein
LESNPPRNAPLEPARFDGTAFGFIIAGVAIICDLVMSLGSTNRGGDLLAVLLTSGFTSGCCLVSV